MYNVIGKRKVFLGISAVLVILAVAAIAVFGFEQGIDFRGGTLWSFRLGDNPDTAKLSEILKSALETEDVRFSFDDSRETVFVRLPEVSEERHTDLKAMLEKEFPGFTEESFQSIGPSIGNALRTKALIALALVLVGISLYIAFAFRKVFRPVSSWKYGWVTLATLFHDILIPAGLLAVLGHYQNVEIDTNFLVALLVIMGFSVHDTIVVFDRIRENLLKERSTSDFATIINSSVNQTISRSINTSLTVIFVLLALYFAGPENLRYFILTLLVGITIGIYSSIFVASPLLYVWHRFSSRKEGNPR